jgi:hypothetical protein
VPNWEQYDNPLELAEMLWEHVCSSQGDEPPPDQFEILFHRVYDAADDVVTLWRLGGATNDYLRFHPGALDVPQNLPEKLLASADVDARVTGLKLLNRCNTSDEAMVGKIIRAMQRLDEYESCGGLHETHEFLDRCERDGRKINSTLVARLRHSVDLLRQQQSDQDLQRSTIHAIKRLTNCRATS